MLRVACLILGTLMLLVIDAPTATAAVGQPHDDRARASVATTEHGVTGCAALAPGELAALGAAGVALSPAERAAARGTGEGARKLEATNVWIFVAVLVVALVVFLVVN